MDMNNAALLIIDVQKGLDDPALGRNRNNPQAEATMALLLSEWRKRKGNPNAPAYSAAKAGLPHRTHQEPRQGTRRQRRSCQLRDAGGGGDPHLRPDEPDPHRLHAVEDPARTFRPAAGDRRHGGLAVLRRLLVLHRRGVRPFEWARHLLTAGAPKLAA